MGILVNMGVGTSDTVPPLLVSGAADMLMPDTPAAGGLLRVKKVAAVAEAYGVPCLMHCSHDLGLKTAAVTHIAASTPNFSGPNDTCYHGLIDDVLAEPLKFEKGKLRVPMGPGLGVEVDEAKVERYRI
jgi:L-alanine-DL-glutamate epimerase-like enolase superfamily enzyme